MNPIEKAVALLEAATDADLARLCGAERLMLGRQLRRWERALDATRDAGEAGAGVLAEIRKGKRTEP
jgi:hypothetical protein